MSFKDKPFEQRFSDTMWNHSERKFEERWPYPYVRTGLGESDDDSPIDTWKLTSFIRHQPDYLTQAHNKLFFIEVQGTGKKGSHKFKQSKLDACRRWNNEHPVYYWLWDDEAQTEAVISHNKIMLLIGQGVATKGLFDGKRPYFAIEKDMAVAHQDWPYDVGRS